MNNYSRSHDRTHFFFVAIIPSKTFLQSCLFIILYLYLLAGPAIPAEAVVPKKVTGFIPRV